MSQELIGHWRHVRTAFDPFFAIPLDKVSKLYAPRTNGPARRIVREIRSAPDYTQVKFVLCGARGSGKSTELTRIAAELFLEYVPLRVDVASILPPKSATLAVCAHIGAAALTALHRLKAPDKPLVPRVGGWTKGGLIFADALVALGMTVETLGKYLEAMPAVSSILTSTEAGLDVPPQALSLAGASLRAGAAGLTARFVAAKSAVSGPLGAYVSQDRMDDAAAVLKGVNAILAEIADHERRPVLIFVEGLDKLESLDEIRVAISQPELLEMLQAPLIVTGPVQLRSAIEFARLPGRLRSDLVNNVAIFEPPASKGAEPKVAPTGIDELLSLYERRRQHFGLSAEVVEVDPLREIARLSSGIPREFLMLLDYASMEAMDADQRVIRKSDVDAALRRRRIELSASFTPPRVRVLYRVLGSGLSGEGEEAEDLLFHNFIACYPNGMLWFRPNELVVDAVRTLGARLEELWPGQGRD